MSVTLVVAVPAAYALAKSGFHPRFVRCVLIALIVVQVLPTIMLLTAPLYEVASRVGVLNNYFTVGVVDAIYAVPFCVPVLCRLHEQHTRHPEGGRDCRRCQ